VCVCVCVCLFHTVILNTLENELTGEARAASNHLNAKQEARDTVFATVAA
jgi:hypothetical protein